MATIGVVCEGSHDFCFIEEVVDQLLIDRGFTNNTFSALQPRLDATSMQIDGGGYEAVYQWLLSNRQAGLRKFLSGSLFASSTVYDAIVVHLDGDVADLSSSFKLSAFWQSSLTVPERISSVRSWALSAAAAEPAYATSIIAAIPTLQMEAWIIAALRPGTSQIESRSRKRATKRFLRNRYSGNNINQVRLAGVDARQHLQQMRNGAVSFVTFCADLERRF